MEWDLLEKTTFRVQGAVLKGANLGDVAAAPAKVKRIKRGVPRIP